MNDDIICPHCKKSFPAKQVFSHQVEEEVKKRSQELEQSAEKKAKEQFELRMKDSNNELLELRTQSKNFQEQILELTKSIRESKHKEDQAKIEFQKKLIAEEERIQKEATAKAEDQQKMRILEFEKKLRDAVEANNNLKQKLEQGSQQTQGEVLEEFLENTLRATFIYDEIQPVPKGIRGADIIQVVKNNRGSIAGKIIWESKRTKSWAGDWLSKLKTDKRSVNAEEAVLVSNVLPTGVKGFGNVEGVWVSNYESIVGVATVLRTLLLMVAGAKSSAVNTEGKKDDLFKYVHSTQFKNRLDAIAEAFKTRKEEIEIEKRWFTKKWAREEKLTEMLLTNNFSLKGEIQAITGNKIDEDDKFVLDGGDEV